MKKYIVCIVCFVFLFSSCSAQDQSEHVVKDKSVVVEALEEKTYIESLSYNAVVVPEFVVKKAFPQSGILSTLSVKKGDKVQVGDLIAGLIPEKDIPKLDRNLDIISSSYDDYKEKRGELSKKAKDYVFHKLNYIAEEGVETELNKSEAELIKASDTYNKSFDDYKNIVLSTLMSSMEIDPKMLMYSDVNGYVVKVLNTQSEMIGGGYPVVIIASEDKVLEAGLTSEDKEKVKIGDVVLLKENSDISAIVTEISQFPDKNTGTYTMRARLSFDTDLNFGENVIIKVQLAKKKGIFISINHILNDGSSYVYVVENSRAVRKDIKILDIDKDMALVSGLDEGDQMIVRGYKAISDGYKVSIASDEEVDGDEKSN